MKKCKLGKYGCYEDGNCYFVKTCVNQIKEDTAANYDSDSDFCEEVD